MRTLPLILALSAPSIALAEDTCDAELVDAYTQTLDATLSTEQQIADMSDRIGEMADRIGEMADRIIVMSDNIVVVNDTSQANSLALAELLGELDTTSGDAVMVQTESGSYMLYAVPVVESTDDDTPGW